MVKTDLNSNTRIKSYGFLNFLKPLINARVAVDGYVLAYAPGRGKENFLFQQSDSARSGPFHIRKGRLSKLVGARALLSHALSFNLETAHPLLSARPCSICLIFLDHN